MENQIDSHKLACVIAQILDDKLGKDITILNISHVSSLADYFVIVSGDSTPQVKALMETVNDMKNRWNLLDYGDVVVHILHKEERDNYALEKFWSHAFSITEEVWRKEASQYSEYTK